MDASEWRADLIRFIPMLAEWADSSEPSKNQTVNVDAAIAHLKDQSPTLSNEMEVELRRLLDGLTHGRLIEVAVGLKLTTEERIQNLHQMFARAGPAGLSPASRRWTDLFCSC